MQGTIIDLFLQLNWNFFLFDLFFLLVLNKIDANFFIVNGLLYDNLLNVHLVPGQIGDFGLSKVKQRTLVSGGVRGTIPWMAPELLNLQKNMVTDKVII